MGRPVNPLFNAVSYYAIMSAMEKMGIDPALLSRQTSHALAPLMKDMCETFLGRNMPKNLPEYFEVEKMLFRMGGVCDPEKVEVALKDRTSTMKLQDCGLQGVNSLAEAAGYPQCPVCMVGAMTIGTLRAMNLAEIKNLDVKRQGNVCSIRLMTE
jgi:hypothetical protein